VFAGGVLASLVLALTACGSSGDSGSSAGASLTSDAVATATSDLAPYTGQASEFPVDEPLATKPPAGTTFAFLQCSTPVCAAQAELIGIATKTLLGNDLIVVKAGPSAQEEQQAMDSIIAKKPSAVIIPATDPAAFRSQMDELDQDGIPVITTGVIGTDKYPAVKGGILAETLSTLAGKLFADWVVKNVGAVESAFYTIPELSFSPLMEQGYKDEMAALCPGCAVREVKVPLASVGSTAPQAITNDLKAHPDTKAAIFASEEATTGLPAALKVAGINVAINGFAPSPTILDYIQKGDITAGLAVDSLVTEFMNVDMAARVVTGQQLTGDEADDRLAMQMITKDDIAGMDLTKGFSAYPDAVERFTKLWNGQ